VLHLLSSKVSTGAHLMRRAMISALALGALAAPSFVRAQGVRNEIKNLFTFGTCEHLFCLADAGGRGDDFEGAADTAGQTLIDFLGSSLELSVSNSPISSSTSGITFRFEGGAPVKTSTSAGPIFAERTQPLGRNRWFVGFDFMQMTFRRLRGIPLSALTFNYASSDAPGAGVDTLGSPSFENDIVTVKMAMDLDLLVASFSVTYGLAYGVDLGVTVPFERLSVHGRSVAQIMPASGDTVHTFAPQTSPDKLVAVLTGDGASTGIGDVEGHLKINLAEGDKFGVALFMSARFPTGETTNFLGSGAFSGRGLGIVSGRFGNFNPHLNLGYTVRDAANRNNSADAVLGFDDLLSPWATLAVDVLGSWQSGASRLHLPRPVQYQAPLPHTMDVTNIPDRRDDLLSFNFGFKFRTQRGIQVVTSALFPLRDSALQPTIAWFGGVEYAF
jgi:hypothetical protein